MKDWRLVALCFDKGLIDGGRGGDLWKIGIEGGLFGWRTGWCYEVRPVLRLAVRELEGFRIWRGRKGSLIGEVPSGGVSWAGGAC